MIALDTDVLNEFLRKPDSRTGKYISAALSKGAALYILPVVEFQVRYGLAMKHIEVIAKRFEEMLPSTNYEEVVRDDWQNAAQILGRLHKPKRARSTRRKLKGSRAMPEKSDGLLAAQAKRLGLTLLTFNSKHFEQLEVKWKDPSKEPPPT